MALYPFMKLHLHKEIYLIHTLCGGSSKNIAGVHYTHLAKIWPQIFNNTTLALTIFEKSQQLHDILNANLSMYVPIFVKIQPILTEQRAVKATMRRISRLVQSCRWCVHAGDRDQWGKYTLLNDALRDIILLVIMLFLILMVIVMHDKIVFQFKNEDLRLMF